MQALDIDDPRLAANGDGSEVAAVFDFSVALASKLAKQLSEAKLPGSWRDRGPEELRALTLGPVAAILEAAKGAVRLFRTIDTLLASDTDELDLELDFDTGASLALEAPQPVDLDTAFARLLGISKKTLSVDEYRDAGALLVPALEQATARLRRACERRALADMLSEAAEVRRKSLSGLKRLLAMAQVLRPETAALVTVSLDDRELDLSLAVRDALFGWRDQVRQITSAIDGLDGVRRAVKLLHGSLVALFALPIYPHLRAPDRLQLEQLRLELQRLVLEPPQLARAAAVIKDVQAFAELLRVVNNREMLVTHDRGVRDRCVAELQDVRALAELSPAQAWVQLRAVLSTLRKLRCRDEDLGRLTEEALMREPREVEAVLALIEPIRERLTALAF